MMVPDKGGDLTGVRKIASYLGYGIGDFGLNIYWNSLSLVLVFWYAEVVGLPPEVAGLIYFIGMVWDAVSDVVVANLTQKTRTRHGTYRPYILFGGMGLAAAFSLLFWVPPLEGSALIVALCLTHVIFRTAYTLVAVPYSALASRLTFSSVERTTFSGVRMAFAFSGLLAVSGLLFPLVRWFGDGTDTSAAGFQFVAFVGAVVAMAALALCFLGTSEQPLPGGMTPPRKLGVGSFLKEIRVNRALTVLLLMIFLQSGAVASFLIPLAFFVEANSTEFAGKEVVMTAYAVSTLISIPFWTFALNLWGKKVGWIAASVIIALSGADLALSGARVFAGVPVQIIGYGIGFGAFGVLVWSLVPDTVEYGQWKTGARNEGAVFGSVLLVQKLSGGLMGLLVGLMLSVVGYDIDLAVQSVETADSLRLHVFLGPTVMLTLSSLAITRLPLNRRIHQQIVEEIQERT